MFDYINFDFILYVDGNNSEAVYYDLNSYEILLTSKSQSSGLLEDDEELWIPLKLFNLK